ncbi:MAG: hypothetical protein NUV86_12670 [Candidatus Scalindua sp.]|nr:hypothetical protein [Candidatus Scalindua sp.]
MSELVQVALIASIAPTIAALANLWIGLKNNAQLKQNTGQLQEVHKLANSNLKRSTLLLKKANEKNVRQQKTITDMEKGKK